MPLMPKRVKFRKQQRGRLRGKAYKGNTVAFGDFGLQVMGAGWITSQQIEAGRVAATHFLHREGRVYIRIFPDKPVSSKPLEVRMGKGKGEPAFWVARVKEGTVAFELGGIEEDIARQALARVAAKLPFRCRMVHRKRGL